MVKTEFSKFGNALENVQKKLQQASGTIDKATVRTRAIERTLREVETLPLEVEQQKALPFDDGVDMDDFKLPGLMEEESVDD